MKLLVPTYPGLGGPILDLKLPPAADLVIVMVNEGHGWECRDHVRLTHQVYESRVRELLAGLTGYPPWCEVAVVPIRSKDIQIVARNDDATTVAKP